MMPLNCISLYHSPLSLFLLILLLDIKRVCSAVANPNFNENIRKYSIKEDNTNATNVSTLLKQGKEQYSHFVPIPNPVTFKTVPDNELSSSSYSRGLLHHADYGVHDYEETPNQGYGYEYHLHDLNNYGHAVNHHSVPIHTNYVDHHGDHYGGNYGNYHGGNYGGHNVGHHYKHHDHDLAAKALLWPIAGIALLGAAAALVSNPVLLQLGVVSGRRKRRDTEEVTGPDDIDIKNWTQEPNDKINHGNSYKVLPYVNKNTMKRISNLFKKEPKDSDTTIDFFLNNMELPHTKLSSDKKYIPIPLKIKPKKTKQLLSV